MIDVGVEGCWGYVVELHELEFPALSILVSHDQRVLLHVVLLRWKVHSPRNHHDNRRRADWTSSLDIF